MSTANLNTYERIIEHIFLKNYNEGDEEVCFARDDLALASKELNIPTPKNLGDVVYSFRYRNKLTTSITSTAPTGKHWVIRGRGKGLYSFSLVKSSPRIIPTPNRLITKIPDATPEIVLKYSLGDEQALLALVRYNRLIDTFLGISAYSLQNHLRTTVTEIGQVEIDELYVGIDDFGIQYIVPVQAKGGTDEIGILQIEQDIAVCRDKFPELSIRPIAAQFTDDCIVLFLLAVQDGELVVAKESHYKLVEHEDITNEDLNLYKSLKNQNDY